MKLKKWLVATALTLLTIFALLVLSSGLFIGFFFNKNQLEKVLTHVLSAPVTIVSMRSHLSWTTFNISLSALNISPTKTSPNTVSMSHLQAKINLWSSLLHAYPVTDLLTVDGLNATLVMSALNPFTNARASTLKSDLGHLVLQHNIALVHGHITLKQADQTATFTAMALRFRQTDKHHYQLVGRARSNIAQTITLKAALNQPTLFSLVDGQAYLAITGLNVKGFNFCLPQGICIQQGQGKLQSWLTLQNSQAKRLQSTFSLDKLKMMNRQTKHTAPIEHLSEHLLWTAQDKGWQLIIHPFHLSTSTHLRKNANNYLQLTEKSHQGDHFHLAIGHIALETITNIISILPHIPETVASTLSHSHPRGEISQLSLHITHAHNTYSLTDLDAHGTNIHVNAYEKIPHISGLAGHIHMTPTWGTLTITGRQFILGENTIFPHLWPKTAVNAHVSWQKKGNTWQAGLTSFSADNAWVHFFASGTALYAPSFPSPIIHLSASTTINHAEEILPVYVPSKIINPNLNHWLLTNIIRVPTLSGKMLWSGPLNHMPYLNHDGVFEVTLNTKHSDVIPWYGWPTITDANTHLFFHNAAFSLSTDQGTMLGAKLVRGQLGVSNMQHHVPSALVIHAQATGTAKAGKTIIEHSPLAQAFQHMLKQLDMQGLIGLGLHLTFPLKQKNQAKTIQGDLAIKNNRLTVIPIGLTFKHFSGNIHFDHLAIYSKDLHSTLWGQPFTFLLTTHRRSTHPDSSEKILTLSGDLDTKQMLAVHYPLLSQLISGTLPLKGTVTLSDSTTHVDIGSTLYGVALNLPAPFYKEPLTSMPVNMHLSIPKQAPSLSFRLTLAHVLTLLGNYPTRPEKRLQALKATIRFGHDQPLTLPPKGIRFTGNIPYLSVADWAATFSKINPYFASSQNNPPQSLQRYLTLLAPSSLMIQRLNIYDQHFPKTQLGIIQHEKTTLLSLKGPAMTGNIALPDQLHNLSLNANLTSLSLHSSATQNRGVDLSKATLTSIPPLKVSIKQLFVNNALLGALTLNTTPAKDGLTINQLDVSGQALSANIAANITKQNTQTHVTLKGHLMSRNWGKVLEQLGFLDLVSRGDGRIDVDLTWRDKLWPISVASLNGHALIKIKDGALTKVNPGIVRLLGIFSVTSLFKRLNLNFNDLTDQGLSFDELQSRFLIQNGLASTQDFILAGPSLSFTMKGIVDFNKQYLDQTILVSPNLEGGLAIGAGIFGGPVVGVATWFAEKILASTIFKNQGIAYQMKGPWQNPSVTKIR